MSKYTPTTGSIRDAYCHVQQEILGEPEHERFHAEFDRWLEAHNRAVAAVAWDECVKSLRYEDGTPVEVVAVVNPYRQRENA